VSLLWLPLLPVLAVQGLRIRKRALRLPEPPGEREGVAGEGRPLRLLILGDSAAAGVGARHQRHALAGQLVEALATDRAVAWRLHAHTGATTADVLASLDALDGTHWDVAVTSLGVNDAVSGVGPRVFAARQARLADALRERFGARLLAASGLPPMHRFPMLPQPLRAFLGGKAKRLDGELAALAANRDDFLHLPLLFSAHLDQRAMAEDGFHPGPSMYREWARALAARILAHPLGAGA
jgi:lysophospholipase L1-like esterase